MAMSEDSGEKAMHMVRVFELNDLTGRETVKGLLFLNGALLRAVEKGYEVDEAMWMNLVSEAIVTAKADD
jgi:hypothetical protein